MEIALAALAVAALVLLVGWLAIGRGTHDEDGRVVVVLGRYDEDPPLTEGRERLDEGQLRRDLESRRPSVKHYDLSDN